MKLKVIITGATGMVGEGVMQECMVNPAVEKILLINRKPSGFSHPKVSEIIHPDFNDITPILDQLSGYDACYFCSGVSSVGMKEDAYTAVTYLLTVNFARSLATVNHGMTFCYVSGAGTDSTEKGKSMWARVKGKTENTLTKFPFKAVFNFRPAFMKATKGAKNLKTLYKALAFLYPLIKTIWPNYVLTMEQVGKAMINVTLKGYPTHTIEVKDIAILAKG